MGEALSEWERGMLLSSMSDGSCAMVMGRSEAWVKLQRAPASPKPEARSPKPEARSPKPEARSPKPERGRTCVTPRVKAKPSPPRAMRLKPVTPRIARWATGFVRARWSLEETAALFDVCPDALGARL